ncbi:hypothetical protein E2C01_092945 [Portunus trituberculatus]|uniref:Uncharacterized protein n=1 Tax=Portunus trituberculatus TaxID=210409 RepID=A0A5B7JHT4_PORTR|nr:hypothetical protein [Portunus trituberculatus]
MSDRAARRASVTPLSLRNLATHVLHVGSPAAPMRPVTRLPPRPPVSTCPRRLHSPQWHATPGACCPTAARGACVGAKGCCTSDYPGLVFVRRPLPAPEVHKARSEGGSNAASKATDPQGCNSVPQFCSPARHVTPSARCGAPHTYRS